jgi:tyrosinase
VPAQRLRRSIIDIQTDWENGKPQELEDLVLAFKGIQDDKLIEDPQSFFKLGTTLLCHNFAIHHSYSVIRHLFLTFETGGFHGAPFRGEGEDNIAFWGGYCQHGNILFPVWHRAYLMALEDALRTIKPNVTLPYLDCMSNYATMNGIPWCLTRKMFTFKDSREIPNPLTSFKLPVGIVDNTVGAGASHSKHAGYTIKRYPLSGLVGTPEDRAETEEHNAKYLDPVENEKILNKNFVDFVLGQVLTLFLCCICSNNFFAILSFPFLCSSQAEVDGKPLSYGIYRDYLKVLEQTPANYTIFSNTTSSAAYNSQNQEAIVSIESPHNAVHLAIGGFDNESGSLSPIRGANGDMGENDVAALDPIFFFHHCFVDYVFWQWQKKHEATNYNHPAYTIDRRLTGTNTSDHGGTQGPSPGFAENEPLSLDSPLYPFINPHTKRPYTGKETINILADPMNYDYDKVQKLTNVVIRKNKISHIYYNTGISRVQS